MHHSAPDRSTGPPSAPPAGSPSSSRWCALPRALVSCTKQEEALTTPCGAVVDGSGSAAAVKQGFDSEEAQAQPGRVPHRPEVRNRGLRAHHPFLAQFLLSAGPGGPRPAARREHRPEGAAGGRPAGQPPSRRSRS
ncbi:hypothetical protein LT493_23125 [Streptomyces tricolor]|nr:hypothetical protein [Streptomyces tricolor]